MLPSGSVHVARGSPAGRPLELYRVGPGKMCDVSTACRFGRSTLVAHVEKVGLATAADSDRTLPAPIGFSTCPTRKA